jgi:hypothetical protein
MGGTGSASAGFGDRRTRDSLITDRGVRRERTKRKKTRSAAALTLEVERLRHYSPGKRRDMKRVKSVRSLAELEALRRLQEAT